MTFWDRIFGTVCGSYEGKGCGGRYWDWTAHCFSKRHVAWAQTIMTPEQWSKFVEKWGDLFR